MAGTMDGIIVDVILFFIIAGNAVLGYRKGLTKLIFSLCSGVIAVILVIVLYKPVTNFIINNTSLDEKLENIFSEKLEYLFEKEDIENTEQLQKDDTMSEILKIYIGDEIANQVQETKENIIQYIVTDITHKIIGTIVYFALFAIIRLLLYNIKNYIELVANLPIVRIINGSGGMVYGIIRGFIIIYAIFTILSLIMPVISDTIIMTSIQNAQIGSKMFNNNVLMKLIFYYL